MNHTVSLPNLGADDVSVTLAGWLVAVGDTVSKGDVIAELESDKTIVELESDADGTVAAFLVEVGTDGIVTGAPLMEMTSGPAAGSSNAASDSPPAPESTPAVAPAPAAVAHPHAGPSDTQEPATPAAAQGETTLTTPADQPNHSAKTAAVDISTGPARLSPIARRMLEMTGQSPDAALERAGGASISASDIGIAFGHFDVADAQTSAALPDAVDTRALEQTTAPFSFTPADGIRRTVAARLSQSKQTAPHYYMSMDIDATELLDWRSLLNASLDKDDDNRLSVNDVLLRLIAESLKREPALNSAWTGDGVRQYERADIAVAVASPRGLLTPVVRAVDSLDVHAIAARVRELADAAKAGKIRSEDLYGATFTVSNLGMYGVKDFAAIIMPPQTAILAVGGIERRPIAAPSGDGTINRPIFTCTLSVDHRAADGVEGARFLALLKALVEEPRRMLL